MNSQVRRSLRKIKRKFNAAKDFASNISFTRSNSVYQYGSHSTYGSSMSSPSPASDSDDDPVFEPTASNESSTDDVRRPSTTLIPCEFCHSQQPSENLTRHQLVCSQNPNHRRRRNLTPNRTASREFRRAFSEFPTPSPSAPPRPRSPSPSEDFPIPKDLQCPITHGLFKDPVIARDGHTYEREAIIRCLQRDKISPLTREPISSDTLISNRLIKKMADEFRDECKRKKLLYKYKLDIDVKKIEQIPYIQIQNKSIYHAEWIKNNSSSINSNINLLHLTGENAEQLANIICRIEPHPNIIQTFGRVEHNDTGILLVQDALSTQTLTQFLKNINKNISISILDNIIYQIVSALQFLANIDIIHGNLTTDNIYIYHYDEKLQSISVKLTNIGDINNLSNKNIPEILRNEHYSIKSDVYKFGLLGKELYSLKSELNDKSLIEYQNLFEHCLATNPDERPTFNKIKKTLNSFITQEEYVL